MVYKDKVKGYSRYIYFFKKGLKSYLIVRVRKGLYSFVVFLIKFLEVIRCKMINGKKRIY